MATTEIPDEIVDEKSGVHFVPVKTPKPATAGGERIWKWVALILSVLLAAGGLVGGLGQAFYVTRSEYTSAQKDEAVSREGMRSTLERLDKTLNNQAAAFHSLAGEMQGVKLDLAVLAAKKDR
jgi:uncharacterized protein HemX